MKLGSNSTAVLKCSTASGYWALLKADTPLLIWSRAFSCVQLVPRAASAATARINATFRMGGKLLFSQVLEGHQSDFVDTRAMRDVDRPGYPKIVQVRTA